MFTRTNRDICSRNHSYFTGRSDCLHSYCIARAEDSICSKLMQYCQSGWPKWNHLLQELKEYWRFQGELRLSGKLLLYQCRIVVPTVTREMTLKKIHDGHQGIQCCRMRVSCSVRWPGISKEIETFVHLCPICKKNATPNREPLLSTNLPLYPGEQIATDLFELNGSTYLIVVDYYSQFIEV